MIVKKSSGITSVHQLAGKKASSASTSTAGPNLKEVVAQRRARLRARLRAGLRAAQGWQGRCLPDRRNRTARHRAAGRPSRRLRFPSGLHQVAQRRLCVEERRAALQGCRQQGAARCRSVGRRGENLRRLVRAAIARADGAQVQNPGRLNKPIDRSSTMHPVFIARSKRHGRSGS